MTNLAKPSILEIAIKNFPLKFGLNSIKFFQFNRLETFVNQLNVKIYFVGFVSVAFENFHHVKILITTYDNST